MGAEQRSFLSRLRGRGSPPSESQMPPRREPTPDEIADRMVDDFINGRRSRVTLPDTTPRSISPTGNEQIIGYASPTESGATSQIDDRTSQ